MGSTEQGTRLVIGIDLGTTNTALASAPGEAPPPAPDDGTAALGRRLGEDNCPPPSIFLVPQLVKAGDVQPRPSLPSCVYLPSDGEFAAGATDLPWEQNPDSVLGVLARERGAEVPLRLVSSAKSWLSYGGVDRQAPILPQQAPKGAPQISPVAAALLYLNHLKQAWNHAHPESPLEAQSIYLTVPASFDAVARDLTMEAAQEAGFEQVVLLEEPQAAFYAWLARQGEQWREVLSAGDRVLVCDVGGGTSDFSLIEVQDDGEGRLSLERIAVGDHILLGGDNMDLALAHHLMQKLAAQRRKLDASQQRALILAARQAKEQLLSTTDLQSVPITILGRGSKLIGGKIRTELDRDEVDRILLDGFFPACAADAEPSQAKRTGFMEIGLPFVSDAAITRHLASFLKKHQKSDKPPTHILFNGGVFNSPRLCARLMEVLGSWGEVPKVLEGADNDLAVAQGAAHYGRVRASGGVRIRGGVARSYYVGIEGAVPAVPGVEAPIRALCVVPFGMEEGTEAEVPGGQLGLVVGEPATFRFLTSTIRKDDAMGESLDEFTWPEYLQETASITATLTAEGLEPGTLVPVRLQVRVTELGTLEIWSLRTDGPGKWRLEYNLRDEAHG